MTELSKTLFVPLYFKYKESIGEKEIYDPFSVHLFESGILSTSNFKIFDNDLKSFNGIISRTIIIDNILEEEVKKNDYDFVANIGCGLDFRNRRLSIKLPWYNIDLPEVIEYRNKIVDRTASEFNIPGNILDPKFISSFPQGKGIFIFEGILMFFTEDEVYSILKKITSNFPDSLIILEVCPEQIVNIKNMNESIQAIGENIHFKWGNNDPHKIENDIENLVYENGFKIMEALKNRWSFLKTPTDEEMNVFNNFRIDKYKIKI